MKNKKWLVFLLLFLSGCGGTSTSLASSLTSNYIVDPDAGDSHNTYSNHVPFYLPNGQEEFIPTADPFCFKADDGAYYLYCSQTYCTMGDHGYSLDYGPVFKSTTLTSWTWVGSVFYGQESYAKWNNGEGGCWAPTVLKVGDHYNFYYVLGGGGFYSDYTGIGVATSTTPYGPWKHYGKLFDSGEIGVKNSIDPYVFSEDGQLYMSFGSGDGIWMVELNSDGTALKGSLAEQKQAKKQIAAFNIFQEDNYEASFIEKKNGFYYLYLSTGSCCAGLSSTYHVVVGRSENKYGPYLDSKGRAIDTYNRGDTIVESNVKKGNGTGHCAIVQDSKGLDWLIYHGYDPNETTQQRQNERVLYLDRLYWQSNGYPTLKDKYPTHENVAGPYLS